MIRRTKAWGIKLNEILICWIIEQSQGSGITCNKSIALVFNEDIFRLYISMKHLFVLMEITKIINCKNQSPLKGKLVSNLAHYHRKPAHSEVICDLLVFTNNYQFLHSHCFFIQKVEKKQHLLFINSIKNPLRVFFCLS